jgi:hypothetical protein
MMVCINCPVLVPTTAASSRSSAPHYAQGRELLRCRQHGEAGSSAFANQCHRLASGRDVARNMLHIRAIVEVQRKLRACVIW